jgi:hypothetical protein
MSTNKVVENADFWAFSVGFGKKFNFFILAL